MPTNSPDYWSKNGGANYKKYQGTKKAKKERASRNAARAKLEKQGRVRKGDGKNVDHKNNNPKDNSPKNLQVISEKANKIKGAKKANRKKKKKVDLYYV